MSIYLPYQTTPTVIYASRIPGVVLDCNIATGVKNGGGTPTDNRAAINAQLALATVANPICLIIDGGSALSGSLLIPSTGQVTIQGNGWDCGFFMNSGANASAIKNFGPTQLNELQVWSAGAQTIVGSNICLSNFRINCNRGTFPNGNINNAPSDGTITTQATYAPDARGQYPGSFWNCGIVLLGCENILIDRLWVYDSTAYHINFFHCTHIMIQHCRIEAGNPTFSGNTDGIHLNGGCSEVHIDNCWFSTGDDCVGINIAEGDAQDGKDFILSNLICVSCQTLVRVYGGNGSTNVRRTIISNVVASGVRFAAFLIGIESGGTPSTPQNQHCILIDGADIQVTASNPTYNSILFLNGNAALIEMSRVKMIEPTLAYPMINMTNTNATIDTLRIIDCGIVRNSDGNVAAYAMNATTGTINNFVVEKFHVDESQAYADIATLFNLNGTTVTKMSIDADVSGVGTVLNVTSSSTVGSIVVNDMIHKSNTGSNAAHSIIVATNSTPVSIGRFSGTNLAGPVSGTVVLGGNGVISSGFPIADSLMGNNSFYLGSDHSNVPCIKVGGTAKTVNLT